MGERDGRGANQEASALDQRTFERFRSRMAGIDAHVPDPPLPALDQRSATGALRTPRLDRRDARQRNVYVLLVVAVAALAVVLMPYLNRPRPAAVDLQPAGPSPTATVAAVAPASPTPAPTPLRQPRVCPQGPTLFELPFIAREAWAGFDWAVIEGRLKAADAQLAIIGTRGPFAGPERPIDWPDGFVTGLVSERVVLLDPTGRVVAREGDHVMLGGRLGLDGRDWTACGIRVLKVARTR